MVFVWRNAGEVYYCTEERYNFLKNKNAVKLIEIVEEKEEISVEEVVNEIVDEAIEEGFERPKKKKTSKK